MADQETARKRQVGLTKLFKAVIHGHRELNSPEDGNRFLEALCAQEDPSKCLETLIAAPEGFSSVAKLIYFSHPALKQLYAGQFLQRVIEQIVQPPTFWNSLLQAYHAQTLTDTGIHAFAWLLLQLLLSHSNDVPTVRDVAEQITAEGSFTDSSSLEVRTVGQKIKHVLDSTVSDPTGGGPGGRHDNDFADYRRIKILPTPDEFASTEQPFYRRADAIESTELERRGLMHLDNQFRLLREDLLGELRNDFQTAIGAKKGRRKTVLTDLQFTSIDCGESNKRKPCSLRLRCKDDIPQLRKFKNAAARKKYVNENKNFIKHQSLGCLICNGGIVAFASIFRDVNQLAQRPSVVVVNIADEASFEKVLLASKSQYVLQFVQVDTAVFAYEPILKCLQHMTEVPLQEQLLDFTPGADESLSSIRPVHIIDQISEGRTHDLKDILKTSRSVQLDVAQAESLLTGISKRVSLIQGPPGTGKSFIGALIAKIFHDHTTSTILVQTYTNHALDQYLEDLLDIGIPSTSIVRLGPKCTVRTKPLTLFEQENTYKRSALSYRMMRREESESEGYFDTLSHKVAQFGTYHVTNQALLDYLEFSEDSEFFDAFAISEVQDEMQLVGHRGRSVDQHYLLRQWSNGRDAGVLKDSANRYSHIWDIDLNTRHALRARWAKEMVKEKVSEVSHVYKKYNQCQERLSRLRSEKNACIIGRKRIIGCTTTAAAKYADQLQESAPGIIIVEEAGEILESHTLTAMSSSTKQLVLIGDHKQLRPKISNYSLSIEKGAGYNLNMSLFERLVLAGVPHTTLTRQHRMRPEISSLIRSLTYPELEDDPKTKNQPLLRGFQDNLMFVSHTHPELNADLLQEKHEEGARASKENEYEAAMVLKCVRYLGQQGYRTDDIVILVPYLGQLYRLVQMISTDNDPILNDFDSYELMRAGLLSSAWADTSKKKIKISTIDNYQGEESNIVIASLTRSNNVGDIGFMAAPQRVNVLLSRARCALIMIGNAETFTNSRKGKEVWSPLVDQLKRESHVYDGFPLKCEQHPNKKILLNTKEAFDFYCPDGGCSEPCGKLLSCGIHSCPHSCHQLQDHSKMKCEAIVTSICLQKHKMSRKCHDAADATCRTCYAEAKSKEKKRQRDHELDQERHAKQLAYAARLSELDDELEHQKRRLKHQADERDRQNVLAQKKQDIASLREKAKDAHNITSKSDTISPREEPTKNFAQSSAEGHVTSAPTKDKVEETISHHISANVDENETNQEKSDAKEDWQWAKQYEGARNEALDNLMSMIGLESVKEQFLSIKNKIDTLVRQNVPLTGERFGAALLGNPGTGKTTVARYYANFFAEVGALPGDHFFEVSGSSLANDGVAACKGYIQKMLDEGGGVFFIDEAYQLVSGNSFGGKAVLDYLLAEVENLTGKIIFILAGYQKHMEALFMHNPGISSRIPIQMQFHDYDNRQLRQIFCSYIDTKYKGYMKLEGGTAGLYARILARRIGRGRGCDGFGNAREVQNRILKIVEYQAKRLRKERRAGLRPDDYLLTKEDLIGSEPSAMLENNMAWVKLQKLIGLNSVKENVRVLLDGIQHNYHRELEEKPLIQYSLNRCFIGSPGTGKTSVAKLYGRILADIGLLSNGEVVVKNPSDFVGDVLGASESKTKAILASTVGKVLIIDEAYMLAGVSAADPYKAAVIDTIVAEVQSTPGEDRCVLLLGYKDQMEEMFRDVNPGLSRRFPLDSAFVFEDFDNDELRKILELKLKEIGFSATDQAKRVAMEALQRARNRPNFGNAGEVDIILDKAKALHQKFLSSGKVKQVDTFEAIDFDPEFDRGERAATSLPQLFQDVVGCEALIQRFEGYQITAANLKALDMDPREQIPFNFLFKGPPGTGKTTTAQKMGKVFYDMGFLSQARVVECSVTDLVGQYVGQTGPKVQKLLEKALGKVLFIDEAYRLAEGGFASEAMDELVDCLTKPKYAQKLVTILAGYDRDMDRLMSMNPGLSSRFTESVLFPNLEPGTCLELLIKTLDKKAQKVTLDLSVLTISSSRFKQHILDLFIELSSLESWGNARDVKSLAKDMFAKLISTATFPVNGLVLTEIIVIQTMNSMLEERSRRSEAVSKSRLGELRRTLSHSPLTQQPKMSSFHPPAPSSANPATQAPEMQSETRPPNDAPIEDDANKLTSTKDSTIDLYSIHSMFKAKRDSNVSDAVWEQLEKDKHAEMARLEKYRRLQKERREAEERMKDLIRAEQAAKDDEEKRQREEQRVKAELERRKREAVLAEIERQKEREEAAQKKLQELGQCPMGYQWIKQTGGYRCAGGSHWLSDVDLCL